MYINEYLACNIFILYMLISILRSVLTSFENVRINNSMFIELETFTSKGLQVSLLTRVPKEETIVRYKNSTIYCYYYYNTIILLYYYIIARINLK